MTSLRTLESEEASWVSAVDPVHLETAEKRSKDFDTGQAALLSREQFWENLKNRRKDA